MAKKKEKKRKGVKVKLSIKGSPRQVARAAAQFAEKALAREESRYV